MGVIAMRNRLADQPRSAWGLTEERRDWLLVGVSYVLAAGLLALAVWAAWVAWIWR